MGNEDSSADETDSKSQINADEGDTKQTGANQRLSPSRRSLLRTAGVLGFSTVSYPLLADTGRAGGTNQAGGKDKGGGDGCEPTQTAKLYPDGDSPDDGFGGSIAIDGNTAVIGASSDPEIGRYSGAAYVFSRQGAEWRQAVKLLADDGEAEDLFGRSVDVDGKTIIIGAPSPWDDDNGSAYVFTRQGGEWSQETKLLAEDGESGDRFGSVVAIDGNTAVIGAPLSDGIGPRSGSVYAFKRQGGQWSQETKLLPDEKEGAGGFGGWVAVDGNTAVITADADDDNGTHSGSAFVFRRRGGQWSQEAKLLANDGEAWDRFGNSVAVDRNTAVIGAAITSGNARNSGSAYAFRRQGGQWSQEAKLFADDGASSDQFGRSVTLDGNTAIVGAPYDDGKVRELGSAYVFSRQGGQWSQATKLLAADGEFDDFFGSQVALDGKTAIISAPGDDEKGGRSGSVYVFELCGQSGGQQNRL